jgi:uncharacterized membrane protein (DUF2068 family)
MTADLRHRIHTALEELMEPELANGIMEMLPPVGWADVATKRDLDVLRIEMGAMRSDIEASLQRGLRTQLLAMTGFNLSLVVAVAAIAGLT